MTQKGERSSRAVGNQYEDLAVEYLQRAGYTLSLIHI